MQPWWWSYSQSCSKLAAWLASQMQDQWWAIIEKWYTQIFKYIQSTETSRNEYCQTKAKFQLQLAWVSSIITVPVVRANPTRPNLSRPGIVSKLVFGMAWYGMVWFGMIWYGLVWFGMVWFGMVWFGLVWYDSKQDWYGLVWNGQSY